MFFIGPPAISPLHFLQTLREGAARSADEKRENEEDKLDGYLSVRLVFFAVKGHIKRKRRKEKEV